MNFYVAGIKFNLSDTRDHTLKTTSIIKALPTIVDDAKKAFSEDAVVFVVLHEYALTKEAIPMAEKKKCLERLRNAVSNYPNLILIPGSFSAFEAFSDANKQIKSNKIIRNYQTNLNKEFVAGGDQVADEVSHLYKTFPSAFNDKNTLVKPMENGFYLENSTYVLTKALPPRNKAKHKKSAPFNEKEKLRLVDKSETIFYIGQLENGVKKIPIQGKELDVALTICLEHQDINHFNKLKIHSPTVHVIISASTDFKEAQTTGALIIHMDNNFGLNVYLNDKHVKKDNIDDVVSALYNLTGGMSKKPVSISSMSFVPYDSNFISLLAVLSVDERLPFILNFKHRIQNVEELIDVFDLLSLKDRASFSFMLPHLNFKLDNSIYFNLRDLAESDMRYGDNALLALIEAGFNFKELASCKLNFKMRTFLSNADKIKKYITHFPETEKAKARANLLKCDNAVVLNLIKDPGELRIEKMVQTMIDRIISLDRRGALQLITAANTSLIEAIKELNKQNRNPAKDKIYTEVAALASLFAGSENSASHPFWTLLNMHEAKERRQASLIAHHFFTNWQSTLKSSANEPTFPGAKRKTK